MHKQLPGEAQNQAGHLWQSSFQRRLLLRPGLEPVRVCPAHCCGCLECTQNVSLLAKGMPLQLVSMPLPHCKKIVSLLAKGLPLQAICNTVKDHEPSCQGNAPATSFRTPAAL